MGHPSLDLANKTAVVIGGTSGIGLTIARGLARAGANVVAAGRRAELVESLSKEIQALGRKSIARTADVTKRASLQSLLDAVLEATGNSALGKGSRGPVPLILHLESSGLVVGPGKELKWRLSLRTLLGPVSLQIQSLQ